MGIEINFAGRLQTHRIDEFQTALEQLLQSMEGTISRSQFHLPDDVTSHVREVEGILEPVPQTYPRNARGELVLVWEVAAPSFGRPFAICCNVDWKGAVVLYDTNNWGSAYPLVSEEERLEHDGLDPTIHEVPVCIRRSHKLQGHLDAVKIVDFVKGKFIPNLWVQDDTNYYEKRNFEALKKALRFTGLLSPTDNFKKLSKADYHQ